MQNLRLPPRTAESEPAFQQGPQGIHMSIKVLKALPDTIQLSIRKSLWYLNIYELWHHHSIEVTVKDSKEQQIRSSTLAFPKLILFLLFSRLTGWLLLWFRYFTCYLTHLVHMQWLHKSRENRTLTPGVPRPPSNTKERLDRSASVIE